MQMQAIVCARESSRTAREQARAHDCGVPACAPTLLGVQSMAMSRSRGRPTQRGCSEHGECARTQLAHPNVTCGELGDGVASTTGTVFGAGFAGILGAVVWGQNSQPPHASRRFIHSLGLIMWVWLHCAQDATVRTQNDSASAWATCGLTNVALCARAALQLLVCACGANVIERAQSCRCV